MLLFASRCASPTHIRLARAASRRVDNPPYQSATALGRVHRTHHLELALLRLLAPQTQAMAQAAIDAIHGQVREASIPVRACEAYDGRVGVGAGVLERAACCVH